jgi:uracil-DNA glycosylase
MVKSRRELMLEEMGLTPVWRLRDGTPPAEPDAAPAALAEHEQRATSNEPPQPRTGDRRGEIMSLEWPALKARVASCTDCPLHARRNKTVFGVGDEKAEWLFVGEGPGAEEDAQGEPFVGQAGRLLDSMLAAIKLKRGDNVYIANIVKCRPPGNRNPEPQEALQCEPYLHRQIDLIRRWAKSRRPTCWLRMQASPACVAKSTAIAVRR